MVDVLDSGPNYVAYSIFDSEEECNQAATVALAVASGHSYDAEAEDQLLRGPILLVTSD